MATLHEVRVPPVTVGVIGGAVLGALYSIGFKTLIPEDTPDWAFDVWLYTPIMLGVLGAAGALSTRRPEPATHTLALAAIVAWGVGYTLGMAVIGGHRAGRQWVVAAAFAVFASLTAALVITLFEAGRRRWGQQDRV